MNDKTDNTNRAPELIAGLEEFQVPPLTQLEHDPRIGDALEKLLHVYDPEIPVNIYELGLIYSISVDKENSSKLKISMTLTSPNCPVAEELPQWVKEAAEKAEGVDEADVEISWDPPWTPSLMAESARYQLNMFD